MTVSTTRPRGEFKTLTKCRLCRGTDLKLFLDFGDVPLAGAFLKPAALDQERYYPLGMQFCESCSNVQVNTVIPVDVLFKNYFYFSSAIQTLRQHFGELAAEIQQRFDLSQQSLIVEIGCNDGVFLRHVAALGIRNVGVDPATNVVASIADEGVVAINTCFNKASAHDIVSDHGKANAVVSSFSFAHIDDMDDVMRGIDEVLLDDGVFIFEIYYLGIVIEGMQYDMMYHEHMSYYTLKCLERFLGTYDFEIFDIKLIPLRSGAVRFYAQRRFGGRHSQTPQVAIQRSYEREQGLLESRTYEGFGARVDQTRVDLLRLLDSIRRENKTIIGYGASGRATMIMNYCGLDQGYLDFVVDDAPAKHGFLTPGTHVPIRPWSYVEDSERQPDYAVVFAWPFIEEVRKRRQDYLTQGGRFIVPLPTVAICS